MSPSPASAPTSPSTSQASTRPVGRRLVVAGVVVVMVSLVAGVALLVLAQVRFDRLVEEFARAPAGCDTTLEFSAAGEFVLFVETAGRLDRLHGGCEVPTVYGRDPGTRPRVQVSVFDPVDGTALDLARVDPREYESGSFRGTSFRRFELDDPGSFVARVQAPDGDDVVLAVGPDPFAAVGPMRIGGVLLAAAGAMVGIVMIVVGLIRRATAQTATAGGVSTAGAPPAGHAPAGHGAWAPAPPPTAPPAAPPSSRPLPPPPAAPPPASPPDRRPFPPPRPPSP